MKKPHDVTSSLVRDLLICNYGKTPQPTDIAIIPFGLNARRVFLVQMYSTTYDKDTPQAVMANLYIPSPLTSPTRT